MSESKLNLILKSLQNIESEIVDLTEKVEELSMSHQEHIEESDTFQSNTETNFKNLSSKVLEIRQIVGTAAMTNGKGITFTSSPKKVDKNVNRSRNRSRSPTKQVKALPSDSSANSLDNSGMPARSKRSKSPVKRITNRKNGTEPNEKRPKKKEPNVIHAQAGEDMEIEIANKDDNTENKVACEDEDMEDFIRDDSSNASEM